MKIDILRLSRVAAILMPLLLPAVVLVLQVRPPGIDLAGPWQWSPSLDAGATWSTLRLPTFFPREGIKRSTFFLRRTVEVNEATSPDDGWTMVLGDLRSSVMRLRVNGVEVGDFGSFETIDKADFNGLEAVSLPGSVVRAGANELVIEVRSATPDYAAIAGHRLVFAPSKQVKPWFIRTSKVESFLRSGPMLVMGFLALVLLVLTQVAAGVRERRLAWRALAICLAATAYLLAHSGLGLTGVASPTTRLNWVFPAMAATTASMLSFTLDYFNRQRPWLVRANLAISLLTWVVDMFLPLGLGYRFFLIWLFFFIFYLLAVAIRETLRKPQPLNLLMMTTFAVVAFAGIGDMLTDLGLANLSRMFSLGLANMPIMAGAVVIGTFIGISEQNRQLTGSLARSNEELARALATARESTRVKSEFLANVSHELRTPLNSIINIPEGLLEGFEGEGPSTTFTGDASRTAHYLRVLHTSGLHLLGVVNQVLDFSKLESGRMVVHAEKVEVKGLLHDVTRTIESLASQRQIRVLTEGDLTLTLQADPVKVAQVLLNLGNNAVKFSPNGGAVTFGVRSTDGGVEFSVKDQGIGIAKEHLSMVFEGFRQVEGGATRRFGGTGLGLAISRRLVAIHGGTLIVESTLGQGSTFIATFPLVPGAPRDVEVVPSAPSARPTVLVIDDEAVVQETLRLSLRHLELDVVAIEDPRKALDAAQSLKPALIVLDVMMPRVSGLTLLRQLRESAALSSTPVLVLSAYPSNRELAEGLGARWMTKPWNPEELVHTVIELTHLDATGASTLPPRSS